MLSSGGEGSSREVKVLVLSQSRALTSQCFSGRHAKRVMTDKLQQVLNAAATCSVVGYTEVWPRLVLAPAHPLHWLDVHDWVKSKLGIMMFSCIHGPAPQYMVDFCQPVSAIASRQHLWSTSQWLVVPRYQLSTYGQLAFSVVGPSVWNSMPDNLRDLISAEIAVGVHWRRFRLQRTNALELSRQCAV